MEKNGNQWEAWCQKKPTAPLSAIERGKGEKRNFVWSNNPTFIFYAVSRHRPYGNGVIDEHW